MAKKNITLKEVSEIRRNLNPEKAFAPGGIKHKDIENKTYLQIVEIFQKRIKVWYFDAAKEISKKTKDYNFSVIIFCCVIIDILSQYFFGKEIGAGDTYIKFFKTYLSRFNHPLKPPIISCSFKDGKWMEEKINDVAQAFYHCFRNGVLHSGRILEYGRINENYPKDIIKIIEWGKNKEREINVHTTALLKELRKIFNSYIKDLKKNKKLKENFCKKLNFEYGIMIDAK